MSINRTPPRFFKNSAYWLTASGRFCFGSLDRATYQKLRYLDITHGKLDTTFFRDDFRRTDKPHAANATQMNVAVEDKCIVFIDDVLYTGRSIRAALTAIESYGRPSEIELLTLIDRRFSRHLPIQPDYVGRQIDSLQNDKVEVKWKEVTDEDAVYLIKETL